ncbi:MAG: intradiol ring-cleavage dioxygenase [Christiangramia sp.]|uniref:dioxygenase family protein n=1 Tax=Christiangramia sp. TaxID=1931228 RepID=UPI0032421397
MKRKDFLRRGMIGAGTILAIPSVLTNCSKDDSAITDAVDETGEVDYESGTSGDCVVSPQETAGPYPIKTPAQLVRENIIADRPGVPLLINIIVQDQSNSCEPVANVLVDVWHCDADGNYSEYGSYTSEHFLRGRQTTDTNGNASFLSIYPGWYRGRAPHIHLEVLDSNENSLKITQIAFPEDVSDEVYSTSEYNGTADTSNNQDGIFQDSLQYNMLDSITGNTTDGFTLTKTIII